MPVLLFLPLFCTSAGWVTVIVARAKAAWQLGPHCAGLQLLRSVTARSKPRQPSVHWQPAHGEATVAAAAQPTHPPVNLPGSIIQDSPLRLYRPHIQGTLALVHSKGGIHRCRSSCLLPSRRAICIQDSSRQQLLQLEGNTLASC